MVLSQVLLLLLELFLIITSNSLLSCEVIMGIDRLLCTLKEGKDDILVHICSHSSG